jgi:hypothetical protein
MEFFSFIFRTRVLKKIEKNPTLLYTFLFIFVITLQIIATPPSTFQNSSIMPNFHPHTPLLDFFIGPFSPLPKLQFLPNMHKILASLPPL